MNLHSPGWFQRYLGYRLREPLPIWQELKQTEKREGESSENPDFEVLDERFYEMARKSGVLFGSPIVIDANDAPSLDLRLLNELDQARLVNVDVLFASLMREIHALAPDLGDYAAYMSRVLIRTVQFYMGREVHSRFFGMDIKSLLDSKAFDRILKSFENKFAKRVKILTKFTLANTLQNSSAFLDIYELIQWNRLFNNQSRRPVYYLQEIEVEHLKVQRQLCLIFAGIIWHSDKPSDNPASLVTEKNLSGSPLRLLRNKKYQMLRRYIQTTRIPLHLKREMLEKIKKPFSLSASNLQIKEPVIIKYILEQTILLSLINSETDPFQMPFVQDLAASASIDNDELRVRISSVANFFHENEDRFDFIRGNLALQTMKDNLNHRLTYIVRKNLSRIINEIKRTGELYTILSRHDGQKLTPEEKKFVIEQLLSISKTIPAIAIFCLPAGSMVLAVLIKVLPFNILPNSFAE